MNMKITYRKFLTALILLLGSLATSPVWAFDLSFVNASAEDYSGPHDITLSADGKRLFVADNNNDRIAVLDADSLKFVFSFGEDILGSPHDVEFDHRGRLLVADTDNSRIAIFRVTGDSARYIGEVRGKFRRPEGVASHPDGNIYVTGASSDDVEILHEGKSINHVRGFSSPHDVIVSKDNSIWIADADNDRLVNMTADLKLLKTIEGPPYHFSGPRYFAIDDKNRLYVADKYNHQIKILSRSGELLNTVGTGTRGMGPGKFNRPEGITIRGNDVWFSDTYNDRIVKYRIVE
ncbi:NHL repeat-containing protein [Kaarinaea lacus]